MLPKRKFIKKQFTAPDTTQTQDQNNHQSTGDLIDQLKSEDNKIKADAISAIANLLVLDNQFEDELFSASTLIELIKVLGTGTQNALTQTALFAINNLCLNQTENNPISKTVKNLFNLGLDKALTELDSTDANLIKPILILMGNIVEFIPKQYRYLVDGIQFTLINGYEKYLSTQKYYDLVLEFLLKSKFQFQSKQYTPEQLKVLQIISNISQMDKLYRNRAIASNLLLNLTQGNSMQAVENFCANFEEFICDIDLEKEYKSNFQNEQRQDQFSNEEDIREDEIAEDVMEEETKSKSKKNKNKNKAQQTDNTHGKQMQQSSPYNLFMDALQGVQILFEFIIDQFEDEDNFNDENDDDEEMEEEQEVQEEQLKNQFNKQNLFQKLGQSLLKIFSLLQKFASLTFIEGQNIIELVLRLVLSFPGEFIGNDKIPSLGLIRLAECIIIHQFKLQMNSSASIPEQILIFNTKTVFEIVLKFKQIQNRQIYLQLPFLVYNGNTIMKVNNQWKQSWIDLLEIFSLFYNPEKVKNVTEQQNREIGKILKQLIVNIPEIQLQQWRAQTIDTVFDIYSNENFDKIFMEYGFIDVLQHILKTVGSSKIGNKKNKKSNKFINDVVTDIQRFLAYKKKMIGL